MDAEERLDLYSHDFRVKTVVGHVHIGALCWCRPIIKDYGRHGVFVFHREVFFKEGGDAAKVEG